MNKQKWLDAAEIFDSWRVIPRIALFAYGVLVFWSSAYIILWYAHLPGIERTGQVTAFMSMLFPTLIGVSGFVFKIYTDGGRDWSAPAAEDNKHGA